MLTNIKICGMTSLSDIQCVNDNHVDFAGFVMFFPKSKRNLSAETAKQLLPALNRDIKSVAVVVSPTVEQLAQIERLGFDDIQIHGILSGEVLEAAKVPILRAFNVSNMDEFERYRDHDKIAGFVFDAVEPGSGQVFDWSLVKHIECPEGKIMLLAGGLNPDNVAEAVEYLHPYGVDVSSGVENADGKGKDPALVRDFVSKVRQM